MDSNNTSMLDRLNQEFTVNNQKNRDLARTKSRMWRYTTILAFLSVIIVISVALLISRMLQSDGTESVSQVLTEEEQKEWKETPINSEEVYVDVNTNWHLTEGESEIFLRLINPPYSAYRIKVRLFETGSQEELLYESEVIEPGTIIERVNLDKEWEAGDYDAVIRFSFYKVKEDEEEIGGYEVDAAIHVESKEE